MKFYLLVISVMSITWSLTAQNPVQVTQTGKSKENLSKSQDTVDAEEALTKVKLLDQIKIDGYRLSFKTVENDGRCPEKVTCAWAGEARIVLEIYDGSEKVIHPIIVPALGCDKKIFSTEEQDVFLKNLLPYPVVVGEKIEAYEILLKIEPKA